MCEKVIALGGRVRRAKEINNTTDNTINNTNINTITTKNNQTINQTIK